MVLRIKDTNSYQVLPGHPATCFNLRFKNFVVQLSLLISIWVQSDPWNTLCLEGQFVCLLGVCVHGLSHSVVSNSLLFYGRLPERLLYRILQARILEWVAMPSSRGSSQPRDRTLVSCVFCTGRRILYQCATCEGYELGGHCRRSGLSNCINLSLFCSCSVFFFFHVQFF